MSNPKALPLRSGTSQAIISASSPLSPNHNHKFRRYKSQNLGNGKQIQKRDLLINVGNATSPFNSATKPQAKGSDLFSNGLDDFHHTKRPSMSTTRNEDASTRAGTLTCLSRNNLKSSQTPYSLTSLNSENYTPSLCTKDMNITIRRSDDNEVQVNTNQRANLNGTILIAGGGFGGDNEVRQASVSLVTESALEALELMGEDNLTQRSNRKEEETKKQNFTIRKEEKVLAVTRSGKKKKKVLERTKSRKTKRENSESKDSIVKNTNRKKEKSIIEYKSNEKNKSVLKKTNTDENINGTQPEQEEKVIREDAKDQNIQINLLTQHITSYQNNIDEIAKTESILEIKTLRANTLENINRGQEFAEMRRIHNASQGGLQERLNIEKKLELKNERGYETFEKRNKYRTNESCSIELARDRSNNQPEDKLHYSSDVSKLMQITRRPTLRRMKSELHTCQNVLDRENQSQNLAVVKEQTDIVPQAPKKEMLITDELHTERLALKEIQAGEQSSQKEAEKMESGKKTRNDERKKVQKKEDKEDLKKSANKRDTQDIWRQNIWDDPQEKPDPKFELFKQTGNNFFELNLENKFLQKYGFLRTFEDNAMSTEEQERIYTENLFDGCNTPENLRTETFSRKIMKTLPTEYSSKESKSEKVLKADPSTMMVRYYDELNPVVIQPKFMASTGSMCVTELWGNKNKQDFYKTMRKPFQSNTIFSLNPQPGVYRPEKPSHNVDPNYKKLLSERIDKENETAGAKSPTMKDNFAFRSSRRARHTRAFVLQGTADSQAAKKVPYNRGYSSRDGA